MRRSLRLTVAALTVGAAMLPLTAMASTTPLGVSHAKVLARIDARLDMRINCPAPASGDSVTLETVDAFVEQAAGSGISSGNGGVVAGAPGQLLWQCTSANVIFPLDVLADVSGRPFHKGAAIVSASLDIYYASGAEFSATYGPAVVNLAG